MNYLELRKSILLRIIHKKIDWLKDRTELFMSKMYELFGIKKKHTTPYNPQEDGLVERSNRIIFNMLRSYVDRKEQWEDFISLTLYSYNTSYYSSIKTTLMVMYGKQPGLSVEWDRELGYEPLLYEEQLKKKHRRYNDLVTNHLEKDAVIKKKL